MRLTTDSAIAAPGAAEAEEAPSSCPALRLARAEAPAPVARAEGSPVERALIEDLDALHRFILFRVGMDAGRAEELLQQTAAAALGAASPPTCPREQRWWLRGIARNLIRRHWRDGRRRSAAMEGWGRRTLALLEGDCPQEAARSREAMTALLGAIAALPAPDQALLYAFYKRGQTRSAIAAELGVTEKSVETRLYRARGRLRRVLLAMDGRRT